MDTSGVGAGVGNTTIEGTGAMLLNPVDEGIMRQTLNNEQARVAEMQRNLRAYEGVYTPPFKRKMGEPDDNVTINVIGPAVDMGVHFLFGAPPDITVQPSGQLLAQVEAEKKAKEAARKAKAQARFEAQQAKPPATPADPADPSQADPTVPPAPDDPEYAGDGEDDDEDGEEAPSIVEQAQAWLDACLEANGWEVFLLDLGTDGGIFGTSFPRIHTTQMHPNPSDPSKPFPRIQTQDPQATRLQWDARDVHKIDAYIWTYNAGSDPRTHTVRLERQIVMRVPGGDPNMTEDDSWLIIDQHSTSRDNVWITDGRTPWAYAWPPIDHVKNLPLPSSAYGRPDIRKTMIQANKAINQSLSNSGRIERYYGHKHIWIKGMKGQEVMWKDTGTGVIIDIPDPGAEVGQIEPSNDSGQAYERRKELYAYILEELGTPSLVLGRTDGNMGTDPSGVSLRIRLIPMSAKTESKRKCYGPAIQRLCKRLLELGGWGTDWQISLAWKEQLPVDPKEERDALKMDRDMGIVSLETIAGKLDYDWPSEKAKLAKEKEENARMKAVMFPGLPNPAGNPAMPPQPPQPGAPSPAQPQPGQPPQPAQPGQQGQGQGQGQG